MSKIMNFAFLNNDNFEFKSENPEEETISHIKSVLVAQKILNEDTPFKLLFSGKILDTDETLQDMIITRGAGGVYDPIRVLFGKVVEKRLNEPTVIKKVERNLSLTDIFHIQAGTHPNSVAATYGDKSFTYQELDKRSNQLAHYLMSEYKVGPNIPVAIMGSDKLEMLICELALLKTGSAFVPFTPDVPSARLAYTLQNCKADLILSCDEKSNNTLLNCNTDSKILNLVQMRDEIGSQSPDQVILENAKPEDPAYILYTSGSTSANPKGVVQTRHGLAGQIKNYTENLTLSEKDHFLQLAPLTHDQAMVDIYGALLNGAELHLFDMNIEKLNKDALKNLIIEKKISIFSSIPSVFSMIFEGTENDTSFPNLRIVTLGGEAVKKEHVKLFQQIAHPEALFINGYGATEFSWISYYVIKKNDPLEGQIPLGIMTTGTKVFLDYSKGEKGSFGELCVSSEYMSPGYWKNEEATQEAFFKYNDKTYYRTGDLASSDIAEIYHFCGRLAWHEKINGKRVNLKAIEDSLLKKYPLEECVVMSYGEETNKKLIAFYKVKSNQKFDKNPKEMRAELREFLMPHEIPYQFVPLTQFPMLENAKVNRHKLREIINSGIEERNLKRESMSTNLGIVEKLFAEILDLDQPPEADFNFMEQGASSLNIKQFSDKLNTYLADQIPKIFVEILEIYSAQTIENIKKLIDEKRQVAEEELKRQKIPQYELRKLINDDKLPIFYKDSINESLSFNFSSMQVLANFYNKEYQISILPCESQKTFIKEMENLIENRQGSQIGITWPRHDDKEGHHTPCIFHIDENNEGHLYVADSIGEVPFKKEDKDYLPEHKFKIKVNIYVDSNKRQEDFSSCSVDLITYLKNGLRMDMAKKITIVPREQVSFSKRRGVPSNVIFFQSPPELLKSAQKVNFSETLDLPIDEDAEVKKNVSFKQHREKYTEESTFVEHVLEGETPKDPPPIQITQNVYLYKKGKKYKKIIDDHKK